jgi:hypothetical protein
MASFNLLDFSDNAEEKKPAKKESVKKESTKKESTKKEKEKKPEKEESSESEGASSGNEAEESKETEKKTQKKRTVEYKMDPSKCAIERFNFGIDEIGESVSRAQVKDTNEIYFEFTILNKGFTPKLKRSPEAEAKITETGVPAAIKISVAGKQKIYLLKKYIDTLIKPKNLETNEKLIDLLKKASGPKMTSILFAKYRDSLLEKNDDDDEPTPDENKENNTKGKKDTSENKEEKTKKDAPEKKKRKPKQDNSKSSKKKKGNPIEKSIVAARLGVQVDCVMSFMKAQQEIHEFSAGVYEKLLAEFEDNLSYEDEENDGIDDDDS